MTTIVVPERVRVAHYVEQVQKLHSSPAVVLSVLKVLEDPDFDIRDVVACLAHDPGLSAALLRLVNSSYFGIKRKVASIRQAVAFLGRRSLRLAVLGFGLVDRLTRGAPAQVFESFWRRALTMAAVSAWLCERRSDVSADEAYTAGLLADVGVLVLTQVETNRYVPLHDKYPHGEELLHAERHEFGADHAAIGEGLLRYWGCPATMVAAVGKHHGPVLGQPILATTLQAANLLAEVLWTPQSPKLVTARRILQTEFNVDLDSFITLAVDTQRAVTNCSEMYRVRLTGQIDCDSLRKRSQELFTEQAIESSLELDSITSVIEQQGP
jgi:HD-like signal output (HDOD) protein